MNHTTHQMIVTWDPLLVILSYVISVFGSYTALRLAVKIPAARPERLPRWLLASAVALGGIAIWSMHFIAMLAYKVDMPISYDPVLTFVSMLVGIAATGLGLFLVGRSDGNLKRLVLAGLATGLGVAGMHYMGMAAMVMEGEMTWNMTLVILSLMIAVVASCVALWLAFHLRGFWQRFGSALVMGLAVSGMHYTGMFAMQMEMNGPVSTSTADGTGLGGLQLGLLIFLISAVVLGVGLFASENSQDEELVFEI